MTKKIPGFKTIVKSYVCKEGSKKILFTLRIIIFDPGKHFVSTDEAKEYWRKEDRISKKKVKDEYCTIFASASTEGRGKSKHFEFNRSLKDCANCIFVVPVKYRREAYKEILNLKVKA